MNDVYGKEGEESPCSRPQCGRWVGVSELDSHDVPQSKYLPNPVIYTCGTAGSRQTGDIVVEVVGGRKEASKVGWVGGKSHGTAPSTGTGVFFLQRYSFYLIIRRNSSFGLSQSSYLR
jgi:hypothetical protein